MPVDGKRRMLLCLVELVATGLLLSCSRLEGSVKLVELLLCTDAAAIRNQHGLEVDGDAKLRLEDNYCPVTEPVRASVGDDLVDALAVLLLDEESEDFARR